MHYCCPLIYAQITRMVTFSPLLQLKLAVYQLLIYSKHLSSFCEQQFMVKQSTNITFSFLLMLPHLLIQLKLICIYNCNPYVKYETMWEKAGQERMLILRNGTVLFFRDWGSEGKGKIQQSLRTFYYCGFLLLPFCKQGHHFPMAWLLFTVLCCHLVATLGSATTIFYGIYPISHLVSITQHLHYRPAQIKVGPAVFFKFPFIHQSATQY